MGLLTEGKPLKWEDSLPYIDYVKQHGIEQFLNIYEKYSNRCCDEFKWGDELEYLLVRAPDDRHTAELSLRALQIQQNVTNTLASSPHIDDTDKVIIHPEYGSFMIEATPFVPYEDNIDSLLNVERNMYSRRQWIEQSLHKDEHLMLMSAFPMLGVDATEPTNGPIAQSQFIGDALINPHPRFGTLTENIRLRRGENVDIYVPIYRDIHTPRRENAIYMDAMAFGMGCCCLQITHQYKEINEARHIYDQLAVLTPILMSLTASTPFLKGKISDFDCRWSVISQSVDDRTHVEKQVIGKSRYDTISSYISKSTMLRNHEKEYNDIDIEYDKDIYNTLHVDHEIDALLSKHVAHLFVRDPLVIYDDLIDSVDDTVSSHHFETIQSTNWQNVRFKPPPSLVKEDIGWRVEFRSMELQFTEFENAAFTVFVTLLAKAILYYDLNLYIPISKVDANFHRAHRRDAVRKEKFWWRGCCGNDDTGDNPLCLQQRSIEEIICGTAACVGLLDIVRSYVYEVIGLNEAEHPQILQVITEYLDFIEKRSKCELLTPAQWLRQFVDKHPEYKHDSSLNETICRDIVDVMRKINSGDLKPKGLLPESVDIKNRYYKKHRQQDVEEKKPFTFQKAEREPHTKLTFDSSKIKAMGASWMGGWREDKEYNHVMRKKIQNTAQMAAKPLKRSKAHSHSMWKLNAVARMKKMQSMVACKCKGNDFGDMGAQISLGSCIMVIARTALRK